MFKVVANEREFIKSHLNSKTVSQHVKDDGYYYDEMLIVKFNKAYEAELGVCNSYKIIDETGENHHFNVCYFVMEKDIHNKNFNNSVDEIFK